MKIFVKNVNGLVLPPLATAKDAAYDISATSDGKIVGECVSRPLDGLKMWTRVAYIEYRTNLFIAPAPESHVFWGHIQGAPLGGAIDWTDINVDYHTLLHPRSSISKTNLVLANSIGLVDNGYRGEILLRFKYIFQPENLIVLPEAGGTRVYGIVDNEKIYQQGEKIVQIKASANIPIEWEMIDDLNQTERGEGGFGSTSK